MPTNRTSIGSQGLEQGGPDLGNDYTTPSRETGTVTDAPIILDSNRQDESDELILDNDANEELVPDDDDTNEVYTDEDLEEEDDFEEDEEEEEEI